MNTLSSFCRFLPRPSEKICLEKTDLRSSVSVQLHSVCSRSSLIHRRLWVHLLETCSLHRGIVMPTGVTESHAPCSSLSGLTLHPAPLSLPTLYLSFNTQLYGPFWGAPQPFWSCARPSTGVSVLRPSSLHQTAFLLTFPSPPHAGSRVMTSI